MNRASDRSYLLPVTLLILAISTVFQIRLDYIFGFRPEFVFSTIIVAAFFLSFFEVLILSLVAVLILNWQPIFSSEMIILFLAPIFAYFINLFFPGRVWFSSMGVILLSILVLYLFFGLSFFYQHLPIIGINIVVSLIFGNIVFVVFDRLKHN